jgi:hypothetical protein
MNKFKIKQKDYDNIGFYIPYALQNEQYYERFSESSLILRNVDRDANDKNNMFKWRNIFSNKIKDLMYIHTHTITIPSYPFINKVKDTSINVDIITLLNTTPNITTNQILTLLIPGDTIQIMYIDDTIIDFAINYDYTICYSLEKNNNTVYKYTRSNISMNESFLYLDIDTNDNLNDKLVLNTSYIKKKFNFKLIPYQKSASNIYYKSSGQYIQKTLNELLNIKYLNISIYDSSYKPLVNSHINKSLYSNNICNCSESDNVPSCYCNYIRHPMNKDNRIDIGLKICLVKNELLNNIFH